MVFQAMGAKSMYGESISKSSGWGSKECVIYRLEKSQQRRLRSDGGDLKEWSFGGQNEGASVSKSRK